ncbi:rhomboid family intramembrane serine protease [Bartonella henselae]|uniref:rhomboid family intramembrane serine protease n=1 Tax=Bartonella henselae TaxID=38323 RepID=UPI00249EE036|nr:rhomboid family intramembrane serine protease [Bartonella henselae]
MKDADRQFNNAFLLPKQPRESFLNIPLTIVILIALCFCIYCVTQYFFSDELYIESLEFFSFTPVLFKAAPLAFAHTIMSYSFMHGSFEHTTINMAWLLVFGSPLVRHFGSLRFLVFLVLTAAISALTYFAFHQNSIASLVGASGAVSGMMGAIARYGFSPVYFGISTQNGRFFGPLWSIKKTLCSKTVLVYVGVWLIINFIIGISSSLFERDDISIAWEAHIGGLVSGFLLVGIFDVSPGKVKIIL